MPEPEEYEQPETVIVEREPDAPPVVPEISDLVLGNARIGDIFPVAPGRELPEGFELCDGEQRRSRDYPEFVKAMNIASHVFTIPGPRRAVEYQQFIIRLS